MAVIRKIEKLHINYVPLYNEMPDIAHVFSVLNMAEQCGPYFLRQPTNSA